MAGEPGSDSDDGGREQAGRVSRENPINTQSGLFQIRLYKYNNETSSISEEVAAMSGEFEVRC